MPTISLKYVPDPILRDVCDPVNEFDSTLSDIVNEMFEMMRQYNGIGLAAPQVGIPRRFFIAQFESRLLTLINPRFLYVHTKKFRASEGCLSIPDTQVNVARNARIQLSGYDMNGQKIFIEAFGLEARVMQHEIDHLNGVLINDYQSI